MTVQDRSDALTEVGGAGVSAVVRHGNALLRTGAGPTQCRTAGAVSGLLTASTVAALVADQQVGWSTTVAECLPRRQRAPSLPSDTTVEELLVPTLAAVSVLVVEAVTGLPYALAFAGLVVQRSGLRATDCLPVDGKAPAYVTDLDDLARVAQLAGPAGLVGTGRWEQEGLVVWRQGAIGVAAAGRDAGRVASRLVAALS